MDIQTVDPYLPHYVYEKSVHPDQPLVWKQFRKKDVTDVDRIVALSQGKRDLVKSMKDWEVVGELLEFYSERWPQEFAEFRSAMPDIRATRRPGAKSKSGEMMYVGAIPPRFMRIMQAVFPLQQFDKKFVWKLVRRIPLFKVVQ